jgi:hypothetical protein
MLQASPRLCSGTSENMRNRTTKRRAVRINERHIGVCQPAALRDLESWTIVRFGAEGAIVPVAASWSAPQLSSPFHTCSRGHIHLPLERRFELPDQNNVYEQNCRTRQLQRHGALVRHNNAQYCSH